VRRWGYEGGPEIVLRAYFSLFMECWLIFNNMEEGELNF
jgi:hypothetical protein